MATKAQTRFPGEARRGLLLSAYAFGQIGQIAGDAALAAFFAKG
ncbi:MAG TPA: hypothetical protein VED84_00685 [Acidimicrobiales bacterium]|nr:hypothetical protein [Acidimicrobiales bacterium]